MEKRLKLRFRDPRAIDAFFGVIIVLTPEHGMCRRFDLDIIVVEERNPNGNKARISIPLGASASWKQPLRIQYSL